MSNPIPLVPLGRQGGRGCHEPQGHQTCTEAGLFVHNNTMEHGLYVGLAQLGPCKLMIPLIGSISSLYSGT